MAFTKDNEALAQFSAGDSVRAQEFMGAHPAVRDGQEGWVNSGYVRFQNQTGLSHDLNYTNAYAFGTDLIRWNMAGGKPYAGLFYRRLGEANVYNYNDYSAIRYNKYGYTYPSAFAGYA